MITEDDNVSDDAPSAKAGEHPGFRQIGERDRLAAHFVRFVTGTFIDPAGYTFERDIVRHPGAVCVAPLEDDGQHVLMVRQYRGALDRFVLELPAGKLDVPGEANESCAARELAEEVGRTAERWTELGSFYNSPGYTDEKTFVYLAEDLKECALDRQGVEEHHMTIESVPLEKAWSLFQSGELSDVKSLIGLLLVRHELELRGA